MGANREYDAARRARLISDGRCVDCAQKKPAGCSTRLCPACSAKYCDSGVTFAERKAKFAADIARIAETAQELSGREQATRLGMTLDRVRYLRSEARRLGHPVPRELTSRKGGIESPRWQALDNLPRCHCGLLLPCFHANARAEDRRPWAA